MTITPFDFAWYEIRLYGYLIFFAIVGLGHILKPKPFMAIIPFLPYRKFIVIFTGFIEIGLGIALLFEDYRTIVIWLTIVYLIAIFPGNIYMALNPSKYPFSKTALYARLPLQLVFILWVYSLNFS